MKQTLSTIEFEILLCTLSLQGKGYGKLIIEAYLSLYNRKISLAAVYKITSRLKDEGLVRAEVDPKEHKKGGRAKVVYSATPFAEQPSKRAIILLEKQLMMLKGL